ncbi:hypothetical protein F5Y08DRAFT_165882 [Xylaria arbuscula]|nr:hypothetical protein F5Y08DRAFT_165882 [Xylaria arbuscula]
MELPDLEAALPQRSLELRGMSHSAIHSSTDTAMGQDRSQHDGLYSQILQDRRAEGEEPSDNDEFYSSYDVERVAINGFPAVAAYHARYPNTRICRSFNHLNQELLLRYESQLTYLHGALADLNVESTKRSEPGDRGDRKSVPFDKQTFISRCLQAPDPLSLVQSPGDVKGLGVDPEQRRVRIEAMRENLVANIERIFGNYQNRVNWQYELKKFPRVSPKVHRRMFRYLKKTKGIDSDGLDYLRANDDFIYGDADPIYERFHSLFIKFYTAFISIVKFLSCGTFFTNGPFRSESWKEKRVRLLIRLLIALSSTVSLLGPVGILLLAAPRKGISLLVVFLSSIVFAFILLAFEIRLSQTLLGVAAYNAVLVVFLSPP